MTATPEIIRLRVALKDAKELAKWRFELVRKYARQNERLIAENLELLAAAERRPPRLTQGDTTTNRGC